MSKFYRIARATVAFLSHIFFRVKVYGTQNIPWEGAVILACNHRSMWDPVFLARGIRKRQMFFMAKQELMDAPVIGAVLRWLGAYGVTRGRRDTSAIDTATQILSEGKMLAVFPEGTRAKEGEPLKPQSGVAAIVGRTRANVLPASIYFDGKIRLFMRVTVRFGRIIESDEFDFSEVMTSSERKQAAVTIMERITGMLVREHEA